MARKHASVEGPRAATAWEDMLGGNPVTWLLSLDEPTARWVTVTAVLDREQTDPAVAARQQVVADVRTLKLVERLPDCWATKATVTPRATYRGFEAFSFGQKKRPSPFARALALAALGRPGDLAPAAAAVDVAALASSKGGRGIAVPPAGIGGAQP